MIRVPKRKQWHVGRRSAADAQLAPGARTSAHSHAMNIALWRSTSRAKYAQKLGRQQILLVLNTATGGVALGVAQRC